MHLEYHKLLMFDEMLKRSVVRIVSKYEIVLEYSLG